MTTPPNPSQTVHQARPCTQIHESMGAITIQITKPHKNQQLLRDF